MPVARNRKSSPEAKSTKTARRAKWSQGYTADQLELLYWNIWAFHRTAEAIRAEALKLESPLGSPAEISLSPAATVNLGLSLELLFKYSIAVSGHRFPCN